MTLAAAAAGKHVLCEKPMALSIAQCREMIEACRARNARLMVAYYRRFWPLLRAMKGLIDDGRLGEVISARVAVTGDIERDPKSILQWKLDPALSGGGFLLDVGSHRIELLLYLLGEVTSVSAFVDYGAHRVDLRSSVLFRFASGVFATGAFSWVTKTALDEFEICGTRAKILAQPLGGDRLLVQEGAESQMIAVEPYHSTHTALIEHTVEAICAGRPHEVSGEVGMRVNQIIEAAYRSARQNRTVWVSETSEGC
jgi:predicted dehydrogenase